MFYEWCVDSVSIMIDYFRRSKGFNKLHNNEQQRCTTENENTLHSMEMYEALNVAEVGPQDPNIYNPLDTATGQPDNSKDTQENFYQNWCRVFSGCWRDSYLKHNHFVCYSELFILLSFSYFIRASLYQ